MSVKSIISLLILTTFMLILAACGGQPANDKDVAVAVATEVETQATGIQAESVSTDGWQSYSNPEGFTIAFPPHWEQSGPSDPNSPLQQIALTGPEGAVELMWGTGLGGGCLPDEVQAIAVAQGELDSCYVKKEDGTEAWEQIYATLPNPDVGFGARGYTLSAAPNAHETLLAIFSTLSFAEADSTAGGAAATDTQTFNVRIDPEQAPNAPVVLYAETPGTATGARNHLYVEGNGSQVLTFELPPGEYSFYGYQTSSSGPEIDYFGAWSPAGGLALVDTATVDEVVLSRPTDYCNPDEQLIWPSPDGGRFPPTNSPEQLMYRGCTTAPAPLESTTVDTTHWYRLTNQFLGEGRSLDSDESEPYLAESGDYSGQYWKLTPLDDDYYRLTNEFLGEDKSLDSDENAPFMGESGDYSGQYWKLTPLGDGYYRLTNEFLGVDKSLDTYSNNDSALLMSDSGDYSGQFWLLTPLGPIE